MGTKLDNKPRRPLEVAEHAPRLTVKRILGEVFQKVTRLDFKVFRTIGELSVRPGEAIRSYVRGARERYSNPFMFAFASATLYIALNNVMSRGVMRFFDPLLAYRTFWPYTLFLLMIPAVALQRLLFRRSGFNFAETYTFALYVAGQLVLLHTLLLPLKLLPSIGWWQTGPLLVVQAVYFLWAVTGFVASRKPADVLRGLLAFTGYAGIALGTLWALVWYMWGNLG